MKFGFLFPGQGAQTVGMAKDLAEKFPAARSLFEKADAILGYPLSRICFEGPEDQLTRTLYAQPAIFVASCACLAIFRETVSTEKPAFVAGLSLGEFTALAAAEVFSFEDGLQLVRARAEAMEKAATQNPGTMASIMGLNQEVCEEIASEAGCQVANLNSPEQTVLSGTQESIEKACQLAQVRGAKRAIPLKVGGAFHSALMEPARQDLEKALVGVKFAQPSTVFIPNAVARPVQVPTEIKDVLAKQLTSPVRWVETMKRAAESEVSHYFELGPGRVLKGLAKKCQPALAVYPAGSAEDLESAKKIFSDVERSPS